MPNKDKSSGSAMLPDAMCRVCDDFKELTGSRKFFKMKSRTGESKKAATGTNRAIPTQESMKITDDYQPYPCPPDSAELGNSCWNFLHTTAAYYPSNPSNENKQNMSNLINLLIDLYPCKRCSKHLAEDVAKHPPDLDSNASISKWFCEMHNRVNVRLGKSVMDCSRIMERYKTGTPGTDCYIDLSEEHESHP